MEVDSIIKLMIVFSVIMLPMLGLTARFALKPIVDAILRLRESGMLPGDGTSSLAAEVRQMRAELHHLHEDVGQVRGEVARLGEAERFDLALRGGQAAARLPAPE